MLRRIVPVNFTAVRVVAAIAIGVAVSGAFGERLYAGDQRFTDIIAGEVAFDAYHKSGDYRLIALFLVVTSIAYVGLGVVPRLRPNRQSPSPGGAERLLVLLFPLLAVGLLLLRWMAAEVRSSTPGLPLAAVCALVLAGVATHRLLGPDSNDRRHCVQRIAMALLTPTFLFATMVGVLICLSAILLVRAPRTLLADHANEITYVFLILGTVLAVIAAVDRVPLENLFRWSLKSQLLVPLALLWPLVGVYENSGELFQANVTAPARILGALVVTAAIVTSWRAIQRRLKGDASLREVILPWTVVAIAVLTVSGTPPPGAFSLGDDFHTGELAIQWRQLTAFDHEAFASFVPIPGLIGGFTGGVNNFLFAGTVTSWPLAVGFTDALIAAITAAVIIRLVGAPVALLVSTTMVLSNLFLPGNRTVFLVLPLAVLALPGLVRRPLLWLGVWTAIAAFGTALVSSTGLALTLGTAPIAVWVAGAWLRGLTRRAFTSREAASLGTLLVVAVAMMASLPNLPSMAEFLREGARSNLAAYGIGLFQFPFDPGLPESIPLIVWRSVWETVRLGAWIVGLPALLALLHIAARRGGLVSMGRGPTPLAVFGIGLGGFFLASIPYAFGRIGEGELSRPGTLSAVFFSLFLPITLMLAGRQLRPAIPLVMSVAWGLAIWGAFFSLRPSDFIRHAVLPIRATEPSHFVDGFEADAPRLGRGLVDDEDLRRLRDLNRVLGATLRPGETYYDATNRSLHYFSSDRKVPTPFSGPFYAADEWSQDQVVEALERNPPPVVWVGPRFFTPPLMPVPNNLRAYRIYKWLLDEARYVPFRLGELEFLIFAERAQMLPPSVERLSDPAALRSLRLGDVAAVPVSWGRSFESLSFRFGPGLPLERAPDPRPGVAAWQLPADGSGGRYDFLLLEMSCSTGSEKLMLAHAEWDSFGGTRQLLMEAGQGRVLVPLGGDPSWLLYGATGTVRIGISSEPHCGDVSFGEASLFHLER